MPPLTAILLLTTGLLTDTGQPSPATYLVGKPPHTQPMAGRFVTIVKSKAPWYAFNFLLARAFRKAVPVYQRIDGLLFKAFSHSRSDKGKYFGGIYLWQSEADARQWYTPNWFAEVERKRGQKPTVAFFPLVNDLLFVPENFDYRRHETTCVTLYLHALTPVYIQQCVNRQPGLLRTFVIAEDGLQGAILLFSSARDANAFLKRSGFKLYERFSTPTLLNNVQPQQQ